MSNAREIVVETTKVRAVFSNRGANDRALGPEGVPQRRRRSRSISCPAAPATPPIKPFTLTVDDQATSARLNEAIYRVTVNGNPVADKVDATASPQTIVFEAAASDGLNVRKTFSLEPTSYVVSFERHGAGRPAGAESDDSLGPGSRRRHRAHAAVIVLLAGHHAAGAGDCLSRRRCRSPRSDCQRIAGRAVQVHRRRRPLLRRASC